MEAVVCKHYQTGYCKFKEHCQKHHVKDICETENCKSKTCNYRHPKVCKYLTAHNTCKFGEHCAYQHKIPKASTEINVIVNKLNALENSANILSEKIVILEKKLEARDTETTLPNQYISVKNVITRLVLCQL